MSRDEILEQFSECWEGLDDPRSGNAVVHDFQMRVGAFVQEHAEGRSSTVSTASQGANVATSVPQVPFYFDPAAVNPALIIGPPPAANSAEQKEDLAEVHRLHDHVSAAEMELARKDALTQNAFLFDTVFGAGFNARALPVTSAFTERLRLDAGFENNQLKARFQRPRPFRSGDPTLKSECGTATEFSYPSGHSMTGYIIAYTLAEMVPEKANEIMARANQYAEHRVHANLKQERTCHFPSRYPKAILTKILSFHEAPFLSRLQRGERGRSAPSLRTRR